MDSAFSRLVNGCSVGALLLGCAQYGARPACPAKGGNPWVEVSSAHFRVISDLPPSEAETAIRELEQRFDALDQAIFVHSRAPTEPTTIVLFEDESTFHAFAPALAAGVFYGGLPNDLEPARFILLHSRLTPRTVRFFLHELTHDIVERNFGAAPPWLNEGLAEYYSTVAVERGQIHVGRALPDLSFTSESSYVGTTADGSWALAISLDDVAPPSVLLRMKHADFHRITDVPDPEPEDALRAAGLYSGAWAFVHMLHDGPEPYPTRYRRFVTGAQSASVDVAFQSAFSDIPISRLDQDFRRYLAARQVVVSALTYVPTLSSSHVTRRALDDAEVHLLWARLLPWNGPDSEIARGDLDEAVRRAPRLAEAHYLRGLFALNADNFKVAEQELTAALRLSPREPRFLLGLVALREKQAEHHSLSEARNALTAAVERLAVAANSANQFRIVAEFFRIWRKPAQALAFAERALARASIDPFVLETYAAILSDLDRREEAVDAQRKAVAFLEDDTELPRLVGNLKRYEARLKARKTR